MQDHVLRTWSFTGHGHRLGNLLPCCKPCNSAKGNKDWKSYLSSLNLSDVDRRASRIESYLAAYGKLDNLPEISSEYDRLLQIREQVMTLLAEADELSKIIRDRASK